MILNAIMQATSLIIDPFNTGNGMGFAQTGQAAGVYFDPLEPIFGGMDVRRIIMAYKNELHPCWFFVDRPNYYFYSPLSSLMPEKDLKNSAYYDEIAGDYDALMDDAHSNSIVREKVTDKFLSKVSPGGRVLDFGGGTGADLAWLTDHGYSVVFCEPSAGMREQAMRRQPENGGGGPIEFLSGIAVDFTGWSENPPVPAPVDAILANFAVINCIRDIGLLFRSLALVVRPGGDMIAVLLRSKIRHELRFLAGFKTDTLDIRYKDHHQTVYMHSTKAIRMAANPFFYFSGRESLRGSVFSLIHLTRK
jgi:SAM-dependent methyltransferase